MPKKLKTLKEITAFFSNSGASVLREPHPSVPVFFIYSRPLWKLGSNLLDWTKGVQFTEASFKIQMPRGEALNVWLVTPGDWLHSLDWLDWDEAQPEERFFFFNPPENRELETWFWVKKEVRTRRERQLNLRAMAVLKEQQKEFAAELDLLGL